MNELLACLTCETAIPIFYNFGGMHETPEFFYHPATGEITEVSINELTEFEANHERHELRKLAVIAGPYTKNLFSEPVSEKYYSVNEQLENNVEGEMLVLKSWREDINHPLRHKIFHGWIELKIESIEIDSKAIIKHLAKKVDDDQTKKFIDSVKKTIINENKHLHQMLIGGPEPFLENGSAIITDHPLTIMLCPTCSLIGWWLDYLRDFAQSTRHLLLTLIEQESKPDGLLALKVEYGFTVHKTEKIRNS